MQISRLLNNSNGNLTETLCVLVRELAVFSLHWGANASIDRVTSMDASTILSAPGMFSASQGSSRNVSRLGTVSLSELERDSPNKSRNSVIEPEDSGSDVPSDDDEGDEDLQEEVLKAYEYLLSDHM